MAAPLIAAAVAPYVGPAILAGMAWLGLREYTKIQEAAPEANNSRANLAVIAMAGGALYLTYKVAKKKGKI